MMSARSMPACRIAFEAKTTESSGVGGKRILATAILTFGTEATPR
jgi:hypothetical protein